jgi:DNA-binding NarL/FixJ family response regulator
MNNGYLVAVIDDNRVFLNNIKMFIDAQFDGEVGVAFYSNFNQFSKISTLANLYIIDYNLEDDVNGIDIIKSLLAKGYHGKIIVASGENVNFIKLKLTTIYNKCEVLSKSDINLNFKILKIIEEEL